MPTDRILRDLPGARNHYLNMHLSKDLYPTWFVIQPLTEDMHYKYNIKEVLLKYTTIIKSLVAIHSRLFCCSCFSNADLLLLPVLGLLFFIPSWFILCFIQIEHSSYHALNGLSLDRRGEILSMTPNRYDLSLGSDKSGSLTRDTGSYDISGFSI